MQKDTTKITTKKVNGKNPSRSKSARGNVVDSSGDVYVDLGVELNDKDHVKFAIAREITSIMVQRGLTQVEVAKIIGSDQAKVSSLARGRLNGFSLERLVAYLQSLGCDIDVHISQQREEGKGEVRVHHAVAI